MKIFRSDQIQSELINLCKKTRCTHFTYCLSLSLENGTTSSHAPCFFIKMQQNVNVWVEEKIRHAHFTFDASKSMTNFQTLHFSQLNQLYI